MRVAASCPQNAERGCPVAHGAVLVLDPATGRPEALPEGGALAAIRTGAASALATDLLARSSSRALAILGTGVQARTRVEGVCRVRTIEMVRVHGRDPSSTPRFVTALAGCGPLPDAVVIERTPGGAVGSADIVCTATSSSTPVFADRELPPGVHINCVGSVSTPMAGIPHKTIARALLVVDSRAAALGEAGDVTRAIAQGAITAGHVHADLGELVPGGVEGRTSSDQVTVFKSVGLPVQDTVAAVIALRRAKEEGTGREVRWT